jgi:hypothetical protein
LTPAGYFVKSIEPGGTKHGVLGQAKFGYLEGVTNADAMGLRVADDVTARSIYQTIKGFPAIRPCDFLLTNAPPLDDTYVGYGNAEIQPGFYKFGDWVNGGCWGTVEGRAILGYYREGAFGDVRRSADRAMKWAKEFRMDAPWSQRGENTSNPWSDTGDKHRGGVVVMVDNFAIPAATIRGLFDYDYRCDRLVLRPRVPGVITEYKQKEPIRFGGKSLYISCHNGGSRVQSVAVNGKSVTVDSAAGAELLYDDLPVKANVEIVTVGGWGHELSPQSTPTTPAATTIAAQRQTDLTATLQKPYAVLKRMDALLANEPSIAEADRAFVREALRAIEAWRERTAVAPQGFFRPMTVDRRNSIVKFYESTALNMYAGLAKRMAVYAESVELGKRRMAMLFQQAQGT